MNIPEVTNTELKVILFLRRPATVQDLAEAFEIQKDSAVVYYSNLIAKGLVVKEKTMMREAGRLVDRKIYSLSTMASNLLKSGYFTNQLERLRASGQIAG